MVLLVKNMPVNAGDVKDTDSIPGSGRSPGEGNGNPLQHSEEFHEQRCSVGYSRLLSTKKMLKPINDFTKVHGLEELILLRCSYYPK